MKRTLYYFHDPMCSWCYGFKATLKKLKDALPDDINLVSVVGGLAPDSTEPMPIEMQQRLQSNWRAIINKTPVSSFNFDFWTKCTPIRSTYPACRAVLIAKGTSDEFADKMIEAIQEAYYQQAKNPALIETLSDIAASIGLNAIDFKASLLSGDIEQKLQNELSLCQKMQVNSYPSLVLKIDNKLWPITIDYNYAEVILEEIEVVSHL